MEVKPFDVSEGASGGTSVGSRSPSSGAGSGAGPGGEPRHKVSGGRVHAASGNARHLVAGEASSSLSALAVSSSGPTPYAPCQALTQAAQVAFGDKGTAPFSPLSHSYHFGHFGQPCPSPPPHFTHASNGGMGHT